MSDQISTNPKNMLNRRDLLKRGALGSAGIIASVSGLALSNQTQNNHTKNKEPSCVQDTKIQNLPFYGTHQAGIITDSQKHLYLLSLDLLSDDRLQIIQLFKDWTKFIDLKINGGRVKDSQNLTIPPKDTGDADDLEPNNLSVTIGFGSTFFIKNGIDRYQIAQHMPKHLQHIPTMPFDNLNPAYCEGDLCIQVCDEDQQMAFHMVRNLIRLATGIATPRWLENGFVSPVKGLTPRNLFGFKDGTANTEHANSKAQDEVIWVAPDEPKWLQSGSYLGYRKIQMHLEVWDRSSAIDHTDTFGRDRYSGAAYGQTHEFAEAQLTEMPADAHTRLAKQTGLKIHRRAYSYSAGVNAKTGMLDAGLLFIAFCSNPQAQLLPMLTILGRKDRLNEYAVHVGSALFACPGGMAEGEYLGQLLFES